MIPTTRRLTVPSLDSSGVDFALDTSVDGQSATAIIELIPARIKTRTRPASCIQHSAPVRELGSCFELHSADALAALDVAPVRRQGRSSQTRTRYPARTCDSHCRSLVPAAVERGCSFRPTSKARQSCVTLRPNQRRAVLLAALVHSALPEPTHQGVHRHYCCNRNNTRYRPLSPSQSVSAQSLNSRTEQRHQ